MRITGTDFEDLVKPFFRRTFEKMGFFVLQVRNQKSGSQDGFDIGIIFLDEEEKERKIFIECKYYKVSKLNWSEIFNKEVQLEASNHNPTAFILLSPLRDLSNIDHNTQAKVLKYFKFPVEFWTPDMDVEKIFALDEELYKKVFDKPKCDIIIDKDEEISKLKIRINLLIKKKELLKYSDIIKINDSKKEPVEEALLKTNLDEKLNSILDKKDKKRIDFHRYRANYKVFLEELLDVNTELRNKILAWENDMRLKADRLTRKFEIDKDYTPQIFFYDFFEEAEKELITFYKDFEIKGDRQKLLNGVVFELAAQCPLNWNSNGDN
jgi:hypothetical protein